LGHGAVFLSGVLIVQREKRLDENLAEEPTQKCPLKISSYAFMSTARYTMYKQVWDEMKNTFSPFSRPK